MGDTPPSSMSLVRYELRPSEPQSIEEVCEVLLRKPLKVSEIKAVYPLPEPIAIVHQPLSPIQAEINLILRLLF